MPGITELLIILVIVLLLFGGKRLKNLGGDIGSAIKGFKKSMDSESKKPLEQDAKTPQSEVVEAEVIPEEKK